MKNKISIIVPVFNTEKYLKECVDSVLSQDYIDWELLLLDDGSSDNSARICDEYALMDTRIKAIHKKNQGIALTRNMGLDLAIGKYIIFLDSDDYWYDSQALSLLYNIAEQNSLDVVRGFYKAVDMGGNDLPMKKISKKKKLLLNKIIDSADYLEYAINGEFFLVLSLFRKSTIGNVRLEPNRLFLEDMELYSRLLLKDMKCMLIPLSFYAYRRNINSISYQVNIKMLSDSFSMCDNFHDCAIKSTSKKLQSKFNWYSIKMYYWTLCTLSSDSYYSARKSIIEQLQLFNLQQKVLSWTTQFKLFHICVIVVLKPNLALLILRPYLKFKNYIYIIGRKIKKIFTRQ